MTCNCAFLKKHRRAMRRVVKDKIAVLAAKSEIVIGDRTHYPARLLHESRMEALYWWLEQLQDKSMGKVVAMKRRVA